MKEREHWKNRSIFIMAAVGSAIGLGNLWRFPYIAAQNGGGAFLVPYFLALLTAGIPIMIIEYGLGVRSQASANIALGAVDRRFRFVGWLAIMGAFAINIYYCVVMSWTWCSLFDVGTITQWADSISTSGQHFKTQLLQRSSGVWQFEGIRWPILAGLVVTWITIWLIIKSGLGKIGKVLLFTVPVPVVLILVLVVRGLTLEGAQTGLNYFLSPDWSKLADPNVWLEAYGQVFFSLSVGFGTMIAYSSFMPRNTEIPNSAAITSFANCSFSFLAGFAVFSVLGYFAVATNTPIENVVSVENVGPGLAFVIYPAALATLPVWVKGFAFLFFLTLLLLGIDSAFSLLETVSAALTDKFDFSRTKSTTIVAVISLVLGLPFVTGAGLYWLDIVDHFLMKYVITFVAIMECIIVGYFLGIKKFASEINRTAEIKLGLVFAIMVKFVTPVILAVTMVLSFYTEVKEPYGGYPQSAIWIIGVGTLLLLIVVSLILSTVRTDTDRERERGVREIN
ncbi:sodium-dependent transporter [Verrucomicrobiota bacterium]